jgi:hypothetical protein
MDRKTKNLTFLNYNLTGPILYHQITSQEKYRPDLISYKYYKSPAYWEELMLANGIFDMFDIVPGLVIEIPKTLDQLLKSEQHVF